MELFGSDSVELEKLPELDIVDAIIFTSCIVSPAIMLIVNAWFSSVVIG